MEEKKKKKKWNQLLWTVLLTPSIRMHSSRRKEFCIEPHIWLDSNNKKKKKNRDRNSFRKKYKYHILGIKFDRLLESFIFSMIEILYWIFKCIFIYGDAIEYKRWNVL